MDHKADTAARPLNCSSTKDETVWPVIFINLERDARRREHMVSQFARLGIEPQRFQATLWDALSQQSQRQLYCPALNRRQFHKPLSSGEKGCYASHIGAWRWLVDSPHAALVVLEDDVQLSKDFVPVLQSIEALDTPWDMIKLMGRTNPSRDRQVSQEAQLALGHSLVSYRRIPSGTVGYVLSRGSAARLLAARVPFGRPVDVDIRHWWECGVRVSGVEPQLVSLDPVGRQSSLGESVHEAGAAAKWRKLRYRFDYNALHLWHRLRGR